MEGSPAPVRWPSLPQQYTLIAAVIGSAILPTLIANAFFLPRFVPVVALTWTKTSCPCDQQTAKSAALARNLRTQLAFDAKP